MWGLVYCFLKVCLKFFEFNPSKAKARPKAHHPSKNASTHPICIKGCAWVPLCGISKALKANVKGGLFDFAFCYCVCLFRISCISWRFCQASIGRTLPREAVAPGQCDVRPCWFKVLIEGEFTERINPRKVVQNMSRNHFDTGRRARSNALPFEPQLSYEYRLCSQLLLLQALLNWVLWKLLKSPSGSALSNALCFSDPLEIRLRSCVQKHSYIRVTTQYASSQGLRAA